MAAADDMLVRWEVESENLAAQRFYGRLGARLRTKTVAAWLPQAYRPVIGPASVTGG
jgi:hypothetical protein